MKALNVNKNFAIAPSTLDISRSRMSRNHTHKTTMNAGKLYPVMVDEILPGDTVRLNVQSVIRMATPIAPVMDNAYIDFYAFFVPRRLTWEHWQEFCGENKTGYWVQPVNYQIPQLYGDANTSTTLPSPKSVAEYIGAMPGVATATDACYYRAYGLIWNEFFRDENLQSPCVVPTGDTDAYYKNSGGDPITDACYGGELLPVCKMHDYFTSALPGPQKSSAVVGVPVSKMGIINNTDMTTVFPMLFHSDGTAANTGKGLATFVHSSGTPNRIVEAESQTTSGTSNPPVGFKLSTDGSATISVTDLRMAFAIQKMYEKMARSGTRYRELLKAFFGVDNQDARMQIPEYLGHARQQIGMQQVVQTSGSNISGQTTPQGNTGAYSLTGVNGELVNKGFTEHGILMVVACIRHDHSYQQGVDRCLSHRKFTDIYLPVFANLSEQAIKNKEIYAQGTSTDDEVFGYQEAWAEYRYKNNRITGELRSTFSNPLDFWHYGDEYASKPTLTAAWIQEGDAEILRTLAVQTHDQFIVDLYFPSTWDRVMPVYSVPGLVDHH